MHRVIHFAKTNTLTIALYHYRTVDVSKADSMHLIQKSMHPCLNAVHHDSLPLYNLFAALHNSLAFA
jgi:hypothetical protein